MILDMEIILAKQYGFCYGVKRAIELAMDSINIAEHRKAFTYGDIIHNPQMVRKLAEQNITSVNDLSEIASGEVVIIRSHGVGPAVYEKIKEQGLVLVDATCPNVAQAQKIARKFAHEGLQVIIVGEHGHPEVKSVVQWAGKNVIVVENWLEATALNLTEQKIGVLSQTTVDVEQFDKTLQVLIAKAKSTKVERTICAATRQRQKAALEMAEEVNTVLVFGGKASANTRHLYDIVREVCPQAFHVETFADFTPEEIKIITNSKKVGITAGASTPDWIVQEAITKLKELNNE